MNQPLQVRRAEPADDPQVLDLLATCLGWRPGDPNAALFAWKHRQSPFGPSPAWVATTADGRLAGFRTFMRWEFTDASGAVVRAVRAVDTATHPDFRGRGVFRELTTTALQDLRHERLDLVFNTPNDQSRPGYLAMGWSVVGRVPMAVRPRSPATLPAVLRARRPAELWSRPLRLGEDPAAWFAGSAPVAARDGTRGRLVTRRSAGFLRWRYGFGPMCYRVMPFDGGWVMLRLRRRGPATELAVLDHSGPASAVARAVRRAIAASGADHAVGLGRVPGLVPVPRLGPLLTARPVCRRPPGSDGWALNLGDVELF